MNMFNFTLTVFFISILSTFSYAKSERHLVNGKEIRPSKIIQTLINTKEEDINLAKIALELSKEIDPTVNIKADLKKIKQLANEVKKNSFNSLDPIIRITALNQVIYDEVGIRYDFSDPKAKKPENNLLSYTLKTNKGSCLTIPLLYMAVAQELHWPIYPVIAQNHLFLRYAVPGGKEINIETTSGGGTLTNSWYINRFGIEDHAIRKGSYMRTLSYKEMAAILLQFNSDYYFKKRNHINAFQYINTAIELFPQDPNLIMAKAFMLRDLWTEFQKKFQIEQAEAFWQESKKYADEAKMLGFKNRDESDYLRQMKEIEIQEELKKRNKPLM